MTELQKLDISPSDLFQFEGHTRVINKEELSNLLAVEIYDMSRKKFLHVPQKSPHLSYSQVIARLLDIAPTSINHNALMANVSRVRKRMYQKKSIPRAKYSAEVFRVNMLSTGDKSAALTLLTLHSSTSSSPHPSTSSSPPLTTSPPSPVDSKPSKEVSRLTKDLAFSRSRSEKYRREMHMLRHKLKRRERKIVKLKAKIDLHTTKITTIQTSKINAPTEKEESGPPSIPHLTPEKRLHQSLKNELETLRKAKKEVTVKLNMAMMENNTIRSASTYMRDKISSLQKDILELKRRNMDLEIQITCLEDIANDHHEISMYISGQRKVSEAAVKCVQELVECGVSTRKLRDVVIAVAKFCGKRVLDIPSMRTVDGIKSRGREMVCDQLSELTPEKETTLHTSPTRKSGRARKKARIFEPNELPSKSAKDTSNTHIGTVEQISETDGSTDLGDTLVTNKESTMSDKDTTRVNFYNMLKDYRNPDNDDLQSD